MIYTSEQIVLGGLLKNRSMVERVARILSPDYFEKSEHRILYAELLEYDQQENLEGDFADDIVRFKNWLQNRKRLKAVGGIEYIVKLFESTVSGADADHHADIVKRDHFKRKLHKLYSQAAQDAKNGAELAELIAGVRTELDAIQAESDAQITTPGLRCVSMDTVEGKKISWLWPNRIPANMLSIVTGNPGIGKSFLSMDMAARITTGRNWPDAQNTLEPGSVLLFTNEESLEFPVKPRLVAHKADCSRVFAFDVLELKTGEPDSFTIQHDLKHLETFLDSIPDCRLIIFDPITAYLGGINANSNAEVRRVLLGLQTLASRRNITVLGISHFSKKADLDAIHRTLGSTAFTAAARSVWAVCWDTSNDDEERPSKRLLLPVKSNYSIDPDGLSFEIIDGQVCFDENPVRSDVDRVMQKKREKSPSKKQKAKDIILDALKDGPVEGDELINIVTDEGISERTATNARTELRNARKIDTHNPGSGKWEWSLL